MPDKKPSKPDVPHPPLKDPENDLKNPASMPREEQGKGGKGPDRDPEGQQGGYHE